MGSEFSSPQSKYDSSPQKQAQITQKAARHRHESALAPIQKQNLLKNEMKREIERKLIFATGSFLLVDNFNLAMLDDDGYQVEPPIYHILDGMDNLLYLKERRWSKGTQKFLVRMGNILKEFIPRYMKMYPEEKEIILNLKTKFKAIYGTPYNRFYNWIVGYSRHTP